MPIISKCKDGKYHTIDIPVDLLIRSFKAEGDLRKKRIAESLKSCKEVPIPKRFFYHPGSDIKSLFQQFQDSDEEIFECPHCQEPHYLDEDYHEGYCKKIECIPSSCDLCGGRMDIHPKIMLFGSWLVTLYGLEGFAHDYNIAYQRFNIMDWISHMEEKSWVNLNDFAQAFTYAKMFFYPDKFLPPYQKYLRSSHWQNTRLQAFEYYGNCCAICGGNDNLNVHHRNYNNLGKETINKDLIVLCRNCHSKFHDKD